MPTKEQVQYMVFPRISTIAEVAWTNTRIKDYKDFTERMKKQYERFDSIGINYFRQTKSVN